MRYLVTSFVGFLLTTAGIRAADVSRFSLLKTQCNIQTSSNAPAVSSAPFGFWARVWQSTNFSIHSATVMAPNFFTKSLSGSGYPLLLSTLDPYATQASLDSTMPAGNYKFAINTVHDGLTNLTLSLTNGSYPPAPHVNNQPALGSIDPAFDFTISWDAFTGGTTSDLIELQILDSAGIVFGSGTYPGAPGALAGQATSIAIPANTLMAGRSYIGRLAFMRVVSTNYAYAPGFAAYAQQTDFYLSTVGATPPVLVSAIPAFGASNVPANAKIVFTFNKPMRPAYSLRVAGVSNTTSKTWSADQKTFTLASAYLWPSNVTETWYLNYFGSLPGFGDTNNSPVMTETLATRFTAGANLLGATPFAPLLQLLNPPTNGTVQLQLTAGEAYRTYQMQASGDLVAWDTLATIIATNNSFLFTDPAAPPTNRHYRAVALP